MSFQYQCSIGNYQELQEHRETIYEMQLEIDKLVQERDEAMDRAAHFETEYEHWRNAARYWQVRCEENKLNNASN